MKKYVIQALTRYHALKRAKIPAEWEQDRQDALTQLGALLTPILQSFKDEGDRMGLPGMAMLKLEHLVAEAPKPLFAAMVSPMAFVRLSVYSATVDKVSKRPQVGDLLLQLEMTETQFNEWTLNSMGGNTPATLIRALDGTEPQYVREADVLVSNFAQATKRAEAADVLDQVSAFAEQLLTRVLHENGVPAERLRSADVDEAVKQVSWLQGRLHSNLCHQLDKVQEHLTSASSVIQQEVHQAAVAQRLALQFKEKNHE